MIFYKANQSIWLTAQDMNKHYEHICLSIPKRIVLMIDFINKSGQITIYSDNNVEILSRNIDYFLLNITNDPYCDYAGDVVNLGYYSIRMLLTGGSVVSVKPFIYATNHLDFSMFKQTIPLRIPNKNDGVFYPFDFVENVDSRDTMHIIDYRFKETHDQDVQIWYSWFDNVNKTGKSRVLQQNFQSAYNKTNVMNEKDVTCVDDILQYHNFKNKTIQIKKNLFN